MDSVTPLQAHITFYYTKVLPMKKYSVSHQRKERVKQTCYGEALTSDEMVAKFKCQTAENSPKSLPTCGQEGDEFEDDFFKSR